MRAHIYLRVSTEEQAEEGYSLQAQERACRLYCDLHGVTVVAIHCDDGYSGTNANRPAFRQLVNDLADGEMVLVHKLDRFARNTHLLLEALQEFERRSIRLVSVTEQIDFSSPIGKVMLTLLAAFGQYYVDNLRAETAKGLREKAERGLWVGPVPFGYRKLDKGRLAPSEDAEVVRLIYLWYTQGDSYNSIVARLNASGYLAYDWKSHRRHAFTRETVRTILKNRAYCGFVSSGGIEHAGQHEPLISLETWEAASARRAARSRHQGPAGPRHSGALAGLLYCARCGGPLWFRYGGGSGNSRWYACARRCGASQVKADQVEYQVGELLALAGADLESADRVFVAVFALGCEVVAVDVRPQYRRLAALAGWTIRQLAMEE